MKKKVVLVAFFFCCIFISSCSRSQKVAKESCCESSMSSALIVDGPIDDGSFNKSCWQGLQKASKDVGFKVAYKQTTQPTEQAVAFESFCDEGYALLIGVGYKMTETIFEQAKLNPNCKYILVDYTGSGPLPDNLLALKFRAEESSFLAGYMAAKMTKTNKVGFIGGIAGDVIDMFDYGFEAGALYANPNVQVVKQYANSFADVSKGKSIAEIMYQNKIDVLYSAAGATGFGIIEAAKEKVGEGQEVWLIGCDEDQQSFAPKAVLTSTLKNTGEALYQILKEYKDGQWKGGEICKYGLQQGAVGIVERSPNVPSSIMEEVLAIKQKICDGEISIPTNAQSFEQFRESLEGARKE